MQALLWYYCSPICGSPTWQVQDLILLSLCSSYHPVTASPLCLDEFMLFLVGSSVFLLMVVQQLVAILVLWQKMSAHPSTLPSWTNPILSYFLHLVDSYSAFKLKLKPPLSPKYRTSCSHPAHLMAHCTCPPKSRNLKQGTVSSLKALIVSYQSLPLQCLHKGHCIF